MLAMWKGGHSEEFRTTVASRIIGRYKANMERWEKQVGCYIEVKSKDTNR